jgi:hypothetical protein
MFTSGRHLLDVKQQSRGTLAVFGHPRIFIPRILQRDLLGNFMAQRALVLN